MPTAASWTERNRHLRAVADVGHLVRFRASAVRRRAAFVWGAALLVLVTLGVAVVPAYTPGAGGNGQAFDILLLLPTALGGFLAVGIVSAAASGGGRELLGRDASAVFPISPTTDHLGALLLSPLNIAWLLQAWTLLGTTAYALGHDLRLATAQIVVLLWIATATAISQAVAWGLESARRVPHGVVGIRALVVGLLGAVLGLQVSGNLLALFDRIPTRPVVIGMVTGFDLRWLQTVGVLTLLLLLAIVVGAVPAHLAAHRVPRDELRVETGTFPARRAPYNDLTALIRTDRGSVWRAVPMRRGVAVLAVGPGLVALLGNLQWNSMTVLPGLVASGGALLFGVNAWCLDGRGALWRESLPVQPGHGLRGPRHRARRVPASGLAGHHRARRGAGRRAGRQRAGRTDLHDGRGDRPGRGGRAPLVGAAPVLGRPALGPRHPGPAAEHGRPTPPAWPSVRRSPAWSSPACRACPTGGSRCCWRSRSCAGRHPGCTAPTCSGSPPSSAPGSSPRWPSN